MELSFRLSDDFVKGYSKKTVKWGFPDAGGNSLGELTFLRTYSRIKEDGQKERWHDVCRRVIEGTYSILKDHCRTSRLPWNEHKARVSAEEAFDRMFEMKWLPPGRGLWMMGTPFVHEGNNSAPLQNCAFVSTSDMTKYHPEKPFMFLMEASMLGVGVGFDTEGSLKGITIHKPGSVREVEVTTPEGIDSREGWCETTGLLLRAYLSSNQHFPKFDYSGIRPEGAPIKGFGGVAAGAGPLIELHESIVALFEDREGEELTSRDIVDIANLIGRCVVSGNVRRSAELALGEPDDDLFLNLKNYEMFPERESFGRVSNNSVKVEVGKQDYDRYVGRVVANGEPGFVYMDLARDYGRLIDPPNFKDYRAKGFNPCVEQTLESYECCTLVETFPTRCTDKADFLRSLKFAYLYAKAVTLLPTHWPETNAVMQRNRRVGCSVSGLAEFVETLGWQQLRSWMNDGYEEVQRRDRTYSEWLGVRESIKTTSIKPSGSVSLLAGVTPGVHWPTYDTYIRRMQFSKDNPIVAELKAAGYKVEPSVFEPDQSVVAEFHILGKGLRTERDVTIFEKANLAILAQRYWADNSVSLTLTFNPDTEGEHIGNILRMHEGQLKSMSFLPIAVDTEVYAQAPYEATTLEQYEKVVHKAKQHRLDWKKLYRVSEDAEGESYCTTDKCDIKAEALVASASASA